MKPDSRNLVARLRTLASDLEQGAAHPDLLREAMHVACGVADVIVPRVIDDLDRGTAADLDDDLAGLPLHSTGMRILYDHAFPPKDNADAEHRRVRRAALDRHAAPTG
ncbi:hypothetical protein [Roseiconus lacunae]|uniref:Uncharacterized protein n=1 Tax=Roseiconus lacunae TaxID=2605694 RepID=A0ABT7PE55_9BACT|nr:hypothetical protein [Roseiconus lacunae]MDM4014618.1 hypothetical protein [Roseiconus lacunae]